MKIDNGRDRNPFLLERYKYILDQKQKLNRTTITVLTIYQAGLGLIATATFKLVSARSDARISADAAYRGSLALLVCLGILSTFAVLLLLGGVAAWLGYRADEGKIEAQVFGEARPRSTWADMLTWYETYIVLAIVTIFALCTIADLKWVVPLVR